MRPVKYFGTADHAYHPDHENLNRCIGNDSPHICLSCADQFIVDSRFPIDRCPKCSSSAIAGAFELQGKDCPFCKRGVLDKDPDFYCIS